MKGSCLDTAEVTVLVCEHKPCGRVFPYSGHGRPQRFCSAAHAEAAKRIGNRERQRNEYTRVSDRTPEDEVESAGIPAYVNVDPDELLPRGELEKWGTGFQTFSSPRHGPSASVGLIRIRKRDEKSRGTDRPGSEKVDPRFPLHKSWADKGAKLDIETIRRKDRSRFGGPIGAWDFGPTPKEPHWVSAEKWLDSLPDDGRGWVNGRSIDPWNMLFELGFLSRTLIGEGMCHLSLWLREVK